MTRIPLSSTPLRSAWRSSIAALTLAVAIGGGGMLAWAATTVTPVADNKAAALEQSQKARELYQQEDYRGANAANDKALELDPTLTDAQLLHRILQSKLGNSGTSPGAAGGATTTPATPSKLLSTQQISLIRLQELGSKEPNVRGRIPRKTLDAYWTQFVKTQAGADLSQGTYNNFINPQNFADQVQLIRQANVPTLAQTVEISSDPADMVPFRNSVHAWVLQNCATAACHGGEKSGKFRLYRPTSVANDATIYTNFYILSQYAPADGGKLLDRGQPEKSDLLQYALPKVSALHAHPGTSDVHRFGDSSNPEFQNIAAWIHGLAYPQPPYGIVFELPGKAAPATAPAPNTKPMPPTPSKTGSK